MHARLLIAAGLSALALSSPAAAQAAGGSVTYLGSDGNVWLSSPDGTRQQRVTSDAGGGRSYASPSLANDGTVVAASNDKWFHVLAPDGGVRRGPWLGRINSLSSSVTAAQVSPEGSTIAYGYLYQAFQDTGQWNLQPRVHFNSTSAPGSSCGAPFSCHTGYRDPRWVHGTPYAGMVSGGGDQVVMQGGSGTRPWLYLGDGDVYDSFDYSRSGNRALLKTTTAQGVGQLFLWQSDGAPPATGRVLCSIAGFGIKASAPRFSPDGTSITWHDGRGVWTSPIATGAGGACSLAPRLVAAGATRPDWGAYELPVPQTEPDPDPGTPPPGTTTTRPPATGSTPATSTTTQAGAVAKALSRQRVSTLLRRGWFTTSYRGASAGGLRVTLSRKGTTLARGTAKLRRAGTVKVKVRLTAAGRRTLRRSRTVRARLTLAFSPKGRRTQTASRTLTLRR